MSVFYSKDQRLAFYVYRYPTTDLISYMELEVEDNNRHIIYSDEDLDDLISFLTQVRSILRGEL